MSILYVFPQNLATARFNFKVLFSATTILGWLDFEGGVYQTSTYVLTSSTHTFVQHLSRNMGYIAL